MSSSSWRTLALVIVVILAVTVAVVTAVSSSRGAEEEATSSAAATTTQEEDQSAPSDGGGDEERGGPDAGLADGGQEDLEQSRQRALDAATVWVNHDLSGQEWREQAEPFFTDTAWENYALPDPQRVTPTRITGDPTEIDVSVATADFLVPTDAGDLEVGLVKEGDDEWYVAYIDKGL